MLPDRATPARPPVPSPARLVLVLGGARSGKSRHAEALAAQTGRRLVYCATAANHGDPEMADRIARHQATRDGRWHTLEVPLDLVAALRAEADADTAIVVDCLTLWLTNVMLGGHDVDRACGALTTALPALAGPVVFVSNEVGSGIVPDNALARRFRDAQGRLNQVMAACCDTVVLVAAGLPLTLKPASPPPITLG